MKKVFKYKGYNKRTFCYWFNLGHNWLELRKRDRQCKKCGRIEAGYRMRNGWYHTR